MLFGQRYADARMAKIDFEPEVQSKIMGWMSKPTNFLYIYGDNGCSKTYFSSALWYHLAYKSHPCEIAFRHEYDFYEELRQAIDRYSADSATVIKNNLNTCRFLIFDDMGAHAINEWRAENFFTLVDMRYNQCLPTVFNSNLSPAEVKEYYGKRTASRIFAKENIIINLEDEKDYRQL